MKELREQLYAMMEEATNELVRRTTGACGALLGSDLWKEYRDAERVAGGTSDPRILTWMLQRMRHLLDQISSL
jgi:hypothetical protein